MDALKSEKVKVKSENIQEIESIEQIDPDSYRDE